MNVFHRYLNLREAYRAVFQRGQWRNDNGDPTASAQRVLRELREFCRADSSCVQFAKDGRVDTHLTAVIEGRREVWLKITQTLNLSDEDLQKLKGTNDDD